MANVYLGHLEPEIDHQTLINSLRNFKKPEDRIAGLIRDNDIQRVVRGHYVLGAKYQKPFSKLVLANRLWGPSYISMESALSFYQAIPERVDVTTSVTFLRSHRVQSFVGEFVYIHLPLASYQMGQTLIQVRDGISIFMAIPEKALADLVIRQKSIQNITHLKQYLLGLRMDPDFIKTFDIAKLIAIYHRCHSLQVKLLLDLRNSYDK